MPPKLNVTCMPGSNWLASHERAQPAGGLSAPVESVRRYLLSHRFDGQQLLGHPAQHARSGFRCATASRHVAASCALSAAIFILTNLPCAPLSAAAPVQRDRHPLRAESGFLAAETRAFRPGNATATHASSFSASLRGLPRPKMFSAQLLWNRLTPSDRQLGDAAGVVAVQAGSLDQKYLEAVGSGIEPGQ